MDEAGPQLDELLLQCKNMTENLGINNTLMLPPELLGTIFTILSTESDGVTHSTGAILTAASVCAHWRGVALSLPILWSTIVLTIKAGLWSPEKTKVYLDRSKSSPLKLEIETGNYYHRSAGEVEAFEVLCHLIMPHVHRCQSISIVEYAPRETMVIQYIVRSLQGRHLPYLQRLVLQAECQRDSIFLGQVTFAFTPPALLELRASGPVIDAFVPRLSLDIITTLHLSRGPGYNASLTFLQVLAACPAVRTLAIYDDVADRWPDDGVAGAGASFMPELKVLRFYGLVTWITEFLMWIGIQRPLDDLSILPYSDQDWQTMTGSGYKNNSITKLTLSAFQESDIVVLGMAAICFPAVQHLALPGKLCTEEAAVASEDRLGFSLWPELQIVSIRDVSESEEELLCWIVAYRKERGFPLTKVCVDAASVWTMKRLAWLRSEVLVEVYDDWHTHHGDVMYTAESESRFINPWRL